MFVEHKEVGEVTEAPARIKKLANAIRKGASLTAPSVETNFFDGQCRTCAVGAAFVWLEGADRTKYLKLTGLFFEYIAQRFDLPSDLLKEVSTRYERNRRAGVANAREEVADWLESKGY